MNKFWPLNYFLSSDVLLIMDHFRKLMNSKAFTKERCRI